MQNIYVNASESQLLVDKGRLLIGDKASVRYQSVPLSMIDRLVIDARSTLSLHHLHKIIEAGSSILIHHPRSSDVVRIDGHRCADVRIRLGQFTLLSDPDYRMKLAVRLIQFKIATEIQTLCRMQRRRPALAGKIQEEIERLRMIHIDKPSYSELLGKEGAASALYFRALQALFAPQLGFQGRNKRPPKDPCNVILSLSYTMVHAEAVKEFSLAGFDTALGFLHAPLNGRDSLACDVLEMLRSKIDFWVWRLFSEGYLRADHFTMHPGTEKPCFLGKAGRALFYEAFEQKLPFWRRQLRTIARRWRQQLEKDYQETDWAGA